MEPAAESPDPHNGVDCEGFTEPEQTPHIRHSAQSNLKREISDFTIFSKMYFGIQLTFDEQMLFYLENLIGGV